MIGHNGQRCAVVAGPAKESAAAKTAVACVHATALVNFLLVLKTT